MVSELRVVFINAIVTCVEDPNLQAKLHEERLHLLDREPVCYSCFSSAYDFQELLASQTVSLLIFGEKRIAINVHERVDPALVFAVVLLLNCLFEGIFGKIQLITNICIFDGDVFGGLLGGSFRVGGFDFFSFGLACN